MVEPSQMAEIRHLVSDDFKIISTFTARAPNPAALFLINATDEDAAFLIIKYGRQAVWDR